MPLNEAPVVVSATLPEMLPVTPPVAPLVTVSVPWPLVTLRMPPPSETDTLANVACTESVAMVSVRSPVMVWPRTVRATWVAATENRVAASHTIWVVACPGGVTRASTVAPVVLNVRLIVAPNDTPETFCSATVPLSWPTTPLSATVGVVAPVLSCAATLLNTISVPVIPVTATKSFAPSPRPRLPLAMLTSRAVTVAPVGSGAVCPAAIVGLPSTGSDA